MSATASTKFLYKWNRSAIWVACGAPSRAPAAYSPPRSRLTILISGCACIQAFAVSADADQASRINDLVALQVHQDRAAFSPTTEGSGKGNDVTIIPSPKNRAG